MHLRTAFENIRRSPFQGLAAVMVLSTTFFVVTLLAILAYSSSQALKYFETRPQIIAFLNDEATPDEISELQNKLGSDTRVKDLSYVSKEEALEIYKEATSDNPLLSELVNPSIFPASIEFSLSELAFAEDIVAELKSENAVDRVGFTASLEGESTLSDVVSRLRKITWYFRVGGAVFGSLLVGTSFLVLLIIIGMRMTTRRNEIEILTLLGATPGFIRAPIILEALIYAYIGVIVGWIVVLLMVLYATPSIISYFGDIPVVPQNTLDLFGIFGIILGLELLVSTFLALTGSMLAVMRART
jgi:cell division transport system permease protein